MARLRSARASPTAAEPAGPVGGLLVGGDRLGGLAGGVVVAGDEAPIDDPGRRGLAGQCGGRPAWSSRRRDCGCSSYAPALKSSCRNR